MPTVFNAVSPEHISRCEKIIRPHVRCTPVIEIDAADIAASCRRPEVKLAGAEDCHPRFGAGVTELKLNISLPGSLQAWLDFDHAAEVRWCGGESNDPTHGDNKAPKLRPRFRGLLFGRGTGGPPRL
jgi:hypothetical protein